MLIGSNDVQLSENYSPTKVADMQYSRVTPVDVELSFSVSIKTLTNQRTKITPEYMENI